jgi:tryptophanyl-tRNA synthetase
MSKTVEGSYINLTDDLDLIKEKLAKTPTDSGKGETVPKEGGVNTLLSLVELFQGEEKRKEYEEAYKRGGVKYSSLKDELSEAIYEELKPIQQKRDSFKKDPEKVEKILQEGAENARRIARATLEETKKAVGLI